MELVPCKIDHAQAASGREAVAAYITVGDRALVPLVDVESPEFRTQSVLSDRIGPAVKVAEQDLYVVVQKGRLFQRAHPEVRVLMDRGRHLIVELAADSAADLVASRSSDFAVRPAQRGMSLVSRRPPAGAARVDWVQDLVDGVEHDAFVANLTQLTAFPTRHSTSPEYLEASAFVRDTLDTLGYETLFESVNVGGAATRNVVASRTGGGLASRDLIYVVAHLDSVNHEGGPGAPAPGADDNASGSAGVVAIARALRHHPSVHDLRLVLVGGEEQGLLGSRQHVLNLPQTERNRVRAVINMDMIGNRNTPSNGVLLEGASISQNLIDALATAAATYTTLAVETSLMPFNSDHVSFLDGGLPAVLTIEAADSANDAVHGAGDVLANIEVDLAVEILKMNVAVLASALGRIV